MIVRIMGEGQREVEDSRMAQLNALDDELQRAVDSDDEDMFRRSLVALLERVRALGEPLPANSLQPSDLLLPHAEAHITDVREMLDNAGTEGLIPD